jgi:hypothetical protein
VARVAVTLASIFGAAGALTVSVAAVVVVDPNTFVNVASYLVPFCAIVVGGVA